MSTVDIKGRDAFSATGSTGDIGFAPINLGLGAGALASDGGGLSPLIIVAAAVVVLLLVM
jgi:hypothetical protein